MMEDVQQGIQLISARVQQIRQAVQRIGTSVDNDQLRHNM